jgi:hypothetical protein
LGTLQPSRSLSRTKGTQTVVGGAIGSRSGEEGPKSNNSATHLEQDSIDDN